MANPRKRKVKFTDKRHAKKGVVASIFALLSIAVLSSGVLISYMAKGNGGTIIGMLGWFSILIAFLGLIFGVASYKEKDRYYLFSGVGTVVNGLLLVLWLTIYVRGFYGF